MPNYCHITVVGHITKDPEVRYTPQQLAVAKAGIAINQGYGAKKSVLFLDVKVFGKRGENFGKMVGKGQAILVAGRLEQESWDDKRTGQKKTALVILADDWQFMDSRPKDGEDESLAPIDAPTTDSGLPADDTPF